MKVITLSDLSMLREFYDIGPAIFYSEPGRETLIGCYDLIDGKDYVVSDSGKLHSMIKFTHAVKLSDFHIHVSTE